MKISRWKYSNQWGHYKVLGNKNLPGKYSWKYPGNTLVVIRKADQLDQFIVIWFDSNLGDLYGPKIHKSNDLQEIKEHIDQFLVRVQKLLPFA